MPSSSDRNLAFLLGIFGAILLVLAGVAYFFFGFVLLALGLGGHALGAWDRSVIDVVVGILVGVFAVFGRSGSEDRTLGAGIALIVLAIVGWFGLGFGGGIVELLASLLTLLSGILYLVARR